MHKDIKPYLINLKAIGSSESGYLSVAENNKNIPFEIKRVFWTYNTPDQFIRGHHAHYNLQQILIAMSGKLIVTNENVKGETTQHILDNPDVGLYIPPLHWHFIQFSHKAVMMSLASMGYDESDYIHDYQGFKKISN